MHDMFTQAGFESSPIQYKHTDMQVTTTHIDTPERFNRVLGLMNEYQTVVPIRHPYLVEESWRRREQPLERMYAAYRRLPRLYEAGAILIPVDSPDRDRFVEKINKSLNVNLVPDWNTVVNGFHNTHALTYKDVKPSDEAKELAKDLNNFLANFYGELTLETVKKKRSRKKVNKDDELIEVIALRRMVDDSTGEMVDAGTTVMKMRKDARIMQDAGSIKVPI